MNNLKISDKINDDKDILNKIDLNDNKKDLKDLSKK